MHVNTIKLTAIVMLGLLAAGCGGKGTLMGGGATEEPVNANDPSGQPVAGTLQPALDVPELDAKVKVPSGWTTTGIEEDAQSVRKVWLSPSGRTAYGVIYFVDGRLALVPGTFVHGSVIKGFIDQMRAEQGEAELIEKSTDEEAGGWRFVARGRQFTVRSLLFLNGREGWFVYAGTNTQDPVMEPELEVARRARDATRVNLPEE